MNELWITLHAAGFTTSNNILILPSQFWQIGLKVTDCTVQSVHEYWCFYGTFGPIELPANHDSTVWCCICIDH